MINNYSIVKFCLVIVSSSYSVFLKLKGIKLLIKEEARLASDLQASIEKATLVPFAKLLLFISISIRIRLTLRLFFLISTTLFAIIIVVLLDSWA
jgi:hypothetical protein